jgi:hypothetical protein
MPLVILLALCGYGSIPANGQAILALSSGAAPHGSPAALNLILTGVIKDAPASLQFKLVYVPADFSAVEVSAGPTAKEAKKSASCRPAAGTLTCLIFGMNTTTIRNGIVAEVRATPAAGSKNTERAIAIEEVSAASPAGTAIKLRTKPGLVKVTR